MLYITQTGIRIPSHVMQRVQKRLANGEDWQKVGTEELRDLIPESDDDLDELNEILSAAEDRNG